MRKVSLVATSLTGLMLPASIAWACGPAADFWVVGLVVAPFLALPYAAFSSLVIASQRRALFGPRPHRFWSWAKASIAAWFVGTAGAAIPAMLAFTVLDDVSNDLALAVLLSTPLVTVIAHLMWLHARRPK